MSTLLSFPNPVNEKAARTVALVVMALAIVALATRSWWLLPVLAYGFVARALSGPTLSPLGWLAQRVIAPRLGAPRPVPGPPKRFAQAIGAVITTTAAVLSFGLGLHTVGVALLGLLIVAAALESLLGFCLGCWLFGLLMRAGVISDEICRECADISARLASRQSVAGLRLLRGCHPLPGCLRSGASRRCGLARRSGISRRCGLAPRSRGQSS